MTEVVVTGAGGFLGRALSADLARRGIHVLGSGRGEPLPKAPGAACVHLAGSSDPDDAERPEALPEAEALAARVLAANYERVIFASTAYVYGLGGRGPVDETAPLAPASAYPRLKAALEPRFPVVARLSNVYGPGQSPLNAVSHVLKQLPGDGVVRLIGSPAAARDFLFVDDAAEGLAALALSGETGVFNLSTGRGTSIAELIALLARLRGVPAPRIDAPASARPSTLVLDPSRAAARFGWRARTSLETGLKSLLTAARP